MSQTSDGKEAVSIAPLARLRGWSIKDNSNQFIKQAIVTFPNGWKGSVIQGLGTYGQSAGLYELAVLGKDGKISYETPVTSDVLGHLSEDEVMQALGQIEALPQYPDPGQRAVEQSQTSDS